MNFKKTKLATAVGTAALAMGLSAPANAVVLGGDNGWEVSFTGTINLFYQFVNVESTSFNANAQGMGTFQNATLCATVTVGGACAVTAGTTLVLTGQTASSSDLDSSKLHEGLLPAFATFKAKSPTVNGLTGTAQISFAPDSNQSKTARQNVGGNQSIDMREVFFNVDGSFGTISAGRTLGIFQRQAILKDQTLFGVGASFLDSGGTTLGRIGFGYVYPAFETRFSYTTPNINGFQLEVGVYNPLHPTFAGAFESDTPGFQGELNYKTTFGGGNIHAFAGGLWNEFEDLQTGDDVTSWGWNAGLDVTYSGFNVWGHYYSGEALGNDLKWFGGSSRFIPLEDVFIRGSAGTAGIGGAPGFICWFETDNAANRGCGEADNDGWVVQGSYTFNGKTKIAGSYGESNQDSSGELNNVAGSFIRAGFNEIENSMWTVGIYHDVTPWLKVVAEYNNLDMECTYGEYDPNFGPDAGEPCGEIEADNFSVGGFIFW